MARLYSNENFPIAVVKALRELGHDVLTSYEAGKANQAVPDVDVLAFALADERILLTMNRKHFIGLHMKDAPHVGIIVCTFDPDVTALAARIHAALEILPSSSRELVRINRHVSAQANESADPKSAG